MRKNRILQQQNLRPHDRHFKTFQVLGIPLCSSTRLLAPTEFITFLSSIHPLNFLNLNPRYEWKNTGVSSKGEVKEERNFQSFIFHYIN